MTVTGTGTIVVVGGSPDEVVPVVVPLEGTVVPTAGVVAGEEAGPGEVLAWPDWAAEPEDAGAAATAVEAP